MIIRRLYITIMHINIVIPYPRGMFSKELPGTKGGYGFDSTK
jgi:hypothetical protein